MHYAIAFLVGLLAFSSHAQRLTVVQADSVRLSLRDDPADTTRVGALLQLSDYYQHRTLNYRLNLDTALVLANQAYTLSKRLYYDKGQQEALFQQGKVFIKQEQYKNVQRLLQSGNEVTRIRLLLELGKNKLRPTYSQQAHLDSALWYFSQAERLSERLGRQSWQQESQIMTGVAYLFKGDCERSKIWFRRVIAARQRAGELKAWLRWATTQYSEWTFCESPDSLSRAFTLARQLGDRPKETLLLLMVGYNYLNEGRYRQAEQAALRALTIQKAIGYPVINRGYHTLLEENRHLEHQYLGNLLNAQSLVTDLSVADTPKSVFYHLEMIKDLERNGFQEDLDWPCFWLGNTYFNLGQYHKGITYFQRSLAVSHRKGEVVVFTGMVRRMAESLIKVGRARQAIKLLEDVTRQRQPVDYFEKAIMATGFGQCYTALQQYKRAEHYYQQTVAWSMKTGRENDQLFAWFNISKFYVATDQYTKAAASLKHTATYPKLLDPPSKMQMHLLQFKIDSALTNYSSALRHYQRYTALKDSLLNETTTKQMAELDVRYQTRQKEQALQLRQKDIRLLTQRSQTQQTQRNALIGGTLLLVALLGLGFNRYRLKQRSNQLLQAQQQEINHKNEDLQRLLTEQERLLKEIHHRVKNNLQVVMSLLNSQAASLHDPTALSAIQQSQHRVQAMALIHQKLYQTEGIARIPMPEYITELVGYLHESYDLSQPIRFDVEVAPIELDVTQAVPLGLIINEAITNVLKYAFPNGRSGTVQVRLHELSQGAYELVIADDGVGLPADFDPAQSRSLGMSLIRGFSEQLGGQLQIKNRPGLSIRLQFQEEMNADRFITF
jgi:two-component sensor histidine kinase